MNLEESYQKLPKITAGIRCNPLFQRVLVLFLKNFTDNMQLRFVQNSKKINKGPLICPSPSNGLMETVGNIGVPRSQ